jgi:hypothetical protein
MPTKAKAAALRRKLRRPAGPSADKRRRFLVELALTANVTAAAKKGGLLAVNFYRLRARDAAFSAAWHDALCEGYARLETDMLAEALAEPDPDISDAVLKARLHRQKLALALLAAHRATVRGERSAVRRVPVDETKGAKARLIATLATMRARAAAHAAAAPAHDGQDNDDGPAAC